ncbi:951_t:CDS:2, partial [Scutellospora calospora]
ISKSRPIITAYSQELQEQVEIESPINDEPPKKNIISHDDIIIPTLAKKLKMNGQLPYSNHDALLGVSDEPDKVKPKPRPESGYMDITDQVENLFEDIIDQVENEQLTVTKKRASVVSQRRRRRSTPRRPTRRSRPNSQRNSKSFSEHYVQTDEIMIPSTVEDEPSNDDGVRKRNRKSRREEYVFLVRDEEEEDEINTEPITYSEPPTSTTPPPLPLEQVPVEQNEILADTNNDSLTAQYERHNITVHPVQSNVAPVALKLERTLTKTIGDWFFYFGFIKCGL